MILHRNVGRARGRRRGLAILHLGLGTILVACGGTTDPTAQFNNVNYSASLQALNGSPLNAISAINTPAASSVRPDASFEFDVALDLDSQGRPVFVTQRRVGAPLLFGGHEVGLQVLAGAFETVSEAPKTGWVRDSVLTVVPGEVVGLRVASSLCQFSSAPYFHSKMVVDSVNVSQRRIWLRILTNPNCGFRGLQPGRPSN